MSGVEEETLVEEAPEVPGAELEERIGRGDGVAVLFTAPWCPTGRILADALLADPDLPVDVIDVAEIPHLADRYLVVSLPTLVALRDGRERGRLLGAFSPAEAGTLLRRALKLDAPVEVDDVPRRRRRGGS